MQRQVLQRVALQISSAQAPSIRVETCGHRFVDWTTQAPGLRTDWFGCCVDVFGHHWLGVDAHHGHQVRHHSPHVRGHLVSHRHYACETRCHKTPRNSCAADRCGLSLGCGCCGPGFSSDHAPPLTLLSFVDGHGSVMSPSFVDGGDHASEPELPAAASSWATFAIQAALLQLVWHPLQYMRWT